MNEGQIQRRGASQTATSIIAASDSLRPGRADYVCGGADDQVLIQRAIDALPDIGGSIFLKSGTYYIDESINLNKPSSDIVGESVGVNTRGTQIYLANGSNCDMISVTGIKCSVRNLALNGNKANQTSGNGIHITTGLAQDFKAYKLYPCYCYDAAIRSYGWHDVYIDVVPEYCGTGFVMESSGERNQILGCDSYSNDVGIELNSDRNIVTNTIIKGGVRGLKILAGEYNTISSCLFNDNSLYGLYLTGDRNKISSCMMHTTGQHAIWVIDSDHNTINDVTIRNPGITTNNSYSGILLFSSSYNNISNCHISSDHANKPIYGVVEQGTANNNIIKNNTFYDHVSKGVLIVGANTKVVQNVGFITENSGTDTVTAATKAVTHGLAVMPAVGDIMITPVADISPAVRWWISGLTSSQFTINLDQAPTNPAEFTWRAIVL